MPYIAGDDILRPIRARGDRIMAGVCVFLWLLSLAFVLVYGSWIPWLAVATPFTLIALLIASLLPGTQFARTSLAVLFMAFSALLIHQSGGLIETHFIIFALMSFLLYYRDYIPICAAAAFAAVHHYVFCRLEMAGHSVRIFPLNHSCSMVWVHVAYVVFEAAVLIFLGRIIRREALEAAAIAALGGRIDAGGAIDLDLSGVEGLGASAEGMLRFLGATQCAVSQAVSVARGISEVSLEMNEAAMRMVAAGSNQQLSSGSVVGIVDRMSSTSRRIAEDCTQVAEVARSSATVIEQGRRSIDQSVQTITSLAASVAVVSQEIQGLHDSSRRIEEIIQLVAELADQSNLLALNASIEAARAGEAGPRRRYGSSLTAPTVHSCRRSPWWMRSSPARLSSFNPRNGAANRPPMAAVRSARPMMSLAVCSASCPRWLNARRT